MGGGRGVLSERVEFLEGCFNWSRMLGALERILKGKVWHNKHMANSTNVQKPYAYFKGSQSENQSQRPDFVPIEYSSAHRPACACISQVGVS